MTKSINKSNIKKTYIKDRAIIKFIKAHSKEYKINYSKLKIPSFINIIKNKEENKNNQFNKNIFNSNDLFSGRNKNNLLNTISFPKFKFSTLSDSKYGFIIKKNNEPKIHSFLFN